MTVDWAKVSGLVSRLHDPIVGVGFDGKVTSWNLGAAKTFGYTPDDILGQSIDMLATSGAREFQQLVASILAGHRIPIYRDKLRTKEGSACLVSIMVDPVEGEHGEIVGIVQIMRPISHLADEEEGLVGSKSEFKRSLGLAIGARLWDSLTEELYQPLTAIIAYLESAQRVPTESGAQLLMAVQRASGQAARAAAIVRSLSKYSLKEVQEPQLVSIRALVLELEEIIKEGARRAHVDVEFSITADASVIVELPLIQHVFYNVIQSTIDAAVRLSSHCVWVSTSLSATHICLEAGVHVPKDRISSGFTSSNGKIDSPENELSFCRMIVADHGGELSIDNARADALSVHCRLPVARDGEGEFEHGQA